MSLPVKTGVRGTLVRIRSLSDALDLLSSIHTFQLIDLKFIGSPYKERLKSWVLCLGLRRSLEGHNSWVDTSHWLVQFIAVAFVNVLLVRVAFTATTRAYFLPHSHPWHTQIDLRMDWMKGDNRLSSLIIPWLEIEIFVAISLCVLALKESRDWIGSVWYPAEQKFRGSWISSFF